MIRPDLATDGLDFVRLANGRRGEALNGEQRKGGPEPTSIPD